MRKRLWIPSISTAHRPRRMRTKQMNISKLEKSVIIQEIINWNRSGVPKPCQWDFNKNWNLPGLSDFFLFSLSPRVQSCFPLPHHYSDSACFLLLFFPSSFLWDRRLIIVTEQQKKIDIEMNSEDETECVESHVFRFLFSTRHPHRLIKNLLICIMKCSKMSRFDRWMIA